MSQQGTIGLAAARGLIHRDLKLANIWLDLHGAIASKALRASV
jgi:hypothetical protein